MKPLETIKQLCFDCSYAGIMEMQHFVHFSNLHHHQEYQVLEVAGHVPPSTHFVLEASRDAPLVVREPSKQIEGGKCPTLVDSKTNYIVSA